MPSKMRVMFLTSLVLVLQGCALLGGKPVILADAATCSELIPKTWANGVAHAPEPAPTPPEPSGVEAKLAQAVAELKKWVGFGVDSDSRLTQANARTEDAIGIVERCEARNAKAVKKSKPGIF